MEKRKTTGGCDAEEVEHRVSEDFEQSRELELLLFSNLSEIGQHIRKRAYSLSCRDLDDATLKI